MNDTPNNSLYAMNQSSQTIFGTFIMKAFSKPKRTYWRGLLAGILTHIFAMVVLLLAYFFLKPFVWFAITNAPYPSAKTPIDPNSVEWLVLQGMNFINWFAVGITIGRWSPSKSWAVVATFLVYVSVLALLAPVPGTQSAFRLACWFLGSPLAIILGNVLYRRREAHVSVLSVS